MNLSLLLQLWVNASQAVCKPNSQDSSWSSIKWCSAWRIASAVRYWMSWVPCLHHERLRSVGMSESHDCCSQELDISCATLIIRTFSHHREWTRQASKRVFQSHPPKTHSRSYEWVVQDLATIVDCCQRMKLTRWVTISCHQHPPADHSLPNIEPMFVVIHHAYKKRAALHAGDCLQFCWSHSQTLRCQ